ncbi:MAG: hypothetical protein QNL04_15825 [SAR324 cluster bacterium]|nr:hypothetical protein [SAR324 cluster bacterium]
MKQAEYFVICEKVITDVSGKNSLINLFENVNTDSLPVNLPSFCFSGKLEFPELLGQEAIFRLVAENPMGEQKTAVDNIKMPINNKKLHLNLFIQGMTFSLAGEYLFFLEMKEDGVWQKIAKTSLDVKTKGPVEPVIN